MSRARFVIRGDADRAKLTVLIAKAPRGTRIDVKEPRRTPLQNDRMWAMLQDVAEQKTHMGRRYTKEEWKILFMHALGREMQFVPALDGSTFVPIGYHSSDLSKEEMSDLIELIACWGAENGIQFNDPADDKEQAA